MSYDRETKVGELLDQALGEQLGLYFQPAWHPKHRLARRRSRSWRWGFGVVATAAAALLVSPFFVQLPRGQQTASNDTLSAIRLPKALRQAISGITLGSFSVASMVPVYGTYPMVSPTGHNLNVTGNFRVGSQAGTALSLIVNNQMQLQGGMLFSQGTPVYAFSGSGPEAGHVITAPKAYPVPSVSKPERPGWHPGLDVSLNSFSAAGPYVYVTHGNLWSDTQKGVWMQSPASPPATTVDSIAALPSNPNHALLVEENPAGLSQGFITSDGGTSWRSWGLGTQTVSTLIAINNRYWAILNGTLAWSSNGTQWNNVLPLNPKRWQVETYAIDPANPNVATVSLIPISGDGVGPVLQTQNGGSSWSEVPNFPAIGEAPTTMAMNTNGDIAALINSNGPVVVRYSAKTQQWSVLPVPSSHTGDQGLGQLAASANGNLIYGAPSGQIYQWIRNSNQWLVINPPVGLDNAGLAANPLQAIGDNQIMAGYPAGSAYFWEPMSIATGKTKAKPAANQVDKGNRLNTIPAHSSVLGQRARGG